MAINGLFILHKGEGMTSQACVSRVKRLLGATKAGHTGTLDPMATGVLPIMLGQATKAGEFLLSSVKHYRATLRLGLTTDTEDITGAVLSTADSLPLPQEVEAVLPRFRGDILQTPPMYSALKVGGQKLVDLARKGLEVERTARPITVLSLTCTPLNERDYDLDVVCSKGTYIRTLCADIGAALGVGGCMAALCRVEAGGFSLGEAVTLEELEACPAEERTKLIRPVETLFHHLSRITLPPFYSRLAHSGCPISLSKLKEQIRRKEGELVTLYDSNGFFALGEVLADNPQLPGTGQAVRPIRQFL